MKDLRRLGEEKLQRDFKEPKVNSPKNGKIQSEGATSEKDF